MRLVLIATVLAASLVPGSAGAKDDKGIWTIYQEPSCQYYLDAYGRTTLETDGYTGPYEAWAAFGWISDYISALNRYQKYDFPSVLDAGKRGDRGHLAEMSMNDVRRWIASWCHDNQSKGLDDAIYILFLSRSNLVDLTKK